MVAALFLALVVLATKPTPSAVITAKCDKKVSKPYKKGSIKRSMTMSIPPGSVVFDDEVEVLASITAAFS
jgi:hypothetical protein